MEMQDMPIYQEAAQGQRILPEGEKFDLIQDAIEFGLKTYLKQPS